MDCGILESNGPESYRNWDALVQAHPSCGPRRLAENGTQFLLDEDFFAGHGGILDPPLPYAAVFAP